MPSRPEPTLPGLDVAFLHRVYRTSALLGLVGAVLIWERFGRPAALGFTCGLLLSLLVFRVMEWMVSRFLIERRGSIAGFTWLKLPFLVGIMGLLWLGAARGWLTLIWVPAGFAVPHLVLLLKLAGTWLVHAQRMDPQRTVKEETEAR